jgi:hypothetical protein
MPAGTRTVRPSPQGQGHLKPEPRCVSEADAVLRIQGAQHHLWLKEALQLGVSYAAELPLDPDFEIRAHASHRLWRAINGRPSGPPFHQLSAKRRGRLALALRALDGHIDGASYRVIADVLFGRKHPRARLEDPRIA